MQSSVTVDFGSRFAESKQFASVFSEGMALVEETADYLDGQGRKDARGLSRHAAIAYASESMRLTTRLMQMASWLLLRRAVSEGEMSVDEAEAQKHRVNLEEVRPTLGQDGLDALPEQLGDLIARSSRLYERILKLDAMMNEKRAKPAPSASSPLDDQLGRLKAAFGGDTR